MGCDRFAEDNTESGPGDHCDTAFPRFCVALHCLEEVTYLAIHVDVRDAGFEAMLSKRPAGFEEWAGSVHYRRHTRDRSTERFARVETEHDRIESGLRCQRRQARLIASRQERAVTPAQRVVQDKQTGRSISSVLISDLAC